MFRKLITNLSFSPSLIGEVANYAKKLKTEETIRRFGLIILFIATVLQIIALVNPTESANKASESDLIYGGVRDVNSLLSHYDKNEQNIKDIFSSIGINRHDIEQLKDSKLSSTENLLTVSTRPLSSRQEGEISYSFKKSEGGTGSIYLTPIKYRQTHPINYDVLSGYSKSTGKFAIIKNSGIIVINNIPNSFDKADDQSVYTSSNIHNNTQNKKLFIANPSDVITYTLLAKNTDKEQTKNFMFTQELSDILEYSDIVSTHGGVLDVRAKVISWPPVDLAPNETQQRSFTVRLKSYIPATATGLSNPLSYDCIMSSNFGNTITTQVKCPYPKLIEKTTEYLPKTKTSTVAIITFTILLIVVLLYLRSAQIKEEIRLIRKDMNEGVLL